jgi:hypothetical protein
VPPIHSSIACRPPSSSPVPSHTYTILSNPARTRSSPSIQIIHSSPPSVRQSHSPPRITILSNLARDGEMLGVPAVSSRSRLRQNDLARYYPKELAAEQIVRRNGITVRSGNRVAAARRREPPSQFRQTTTPTATPTTPSVALMVSRINKRIRLHSARSNPSSRQLPMAQTRSSTIRAM